MLLIKWRSIISLEVPIQKVQVQVIIGHEIPQPLLECRRLVLMVEQDVDGGRKKKSPPQYPDSEQFNSGLNIGSIYSKDISFDDQRQALSYKELQIMQINRKSSNPFSYVYSYSYLRLISTLSKTGPRLDIGHSFICYRPSHCHPSMLYEQSLNGLDQGPISIRIII